jgi:hypothetical protein
MVFLRRAAAAVFTVANLLAQTTGPANPGAVNTINDNQCPAYPSAMRTELESSLQLDRDSAAYSRGARSFHGPFTPNNTGLAKSQNFIDQAIYSKMAADSVQSAPQSSDAEFLRRLSLDLSGRIPTPDKAAAFLNDSNPLKRAQLVEELLASPAYADQLSTFLTNRYKVTRAHDNISTPARDTFYKFVRGLFEKDQPYDEFIRQLLQASGEVDNAPGTQFFARWMDLNGPIQDSWDDITEKITTGLLGYKTECVSCHDGRSHLEKINLFLSRKKRADLWKMSAFLSRMQFVRLSDDPIGFRPRVVVVDRTYGTYSGSVSPTNPGCRPPRVDAVVTPAMFHTGQEPADGRWRLNLAWMLTTDRQFARATVNYLWSYLFGYGIVDPPDGWDMARVDPNNPPPGDWPIQNSNPALLEALTDSFIQNGYHIKPLIRQIVNSETYQLSSRYEGQWRPAYVRYFARYQARRLSAEQMYDSVITATHTEQPMALVSGSQQVWYANQLPDTTEPFSDYRVTDFLTQFGRGNWWTIDRASQPTILGLLFMMNDSNNVYRSLGLSNANVGITNRVHEVDAKYPMDPDAIRQMFLATLSRYPTDAELNIVMARRTGPRYQWLSDLQWVLLNKLDFAFNL